MHVADTLLAARVRAVDAVRLFLLQPRAADL